MVDSTPFGKSTRFSAYSLNNWEECNDPWP